jgi:hypothetical protein
VVSVPSLLQAACDRDASDPVPTPPWRKIAFLCFLRRGGGVGPVPPPLADCPLRARRPPPLRCPGPGRHGRAGAWRREAQKRVFLGLGPMGLGGWVDDAGLRGEGLKQWGMALASSVAVLCLECRRRRRRVEVWS